MSEAPAWQTDLALAAREYWLCDGQIEGLQRLSAGASAETWRFDFVFGKARHPCILRKDALASDGSMSLCISKSLEFAVVRTAQNAGVPAAEPYFEFQSGYVMQRLDGETLPRKILRDERYACARPRLTDQCAQALARIHATPTLSGLPILNADTQLQELERLYRDYALASPTFDVAFRWLREHLPEPADLTLVHGDFRNGNLMVDGNGLRGVLDWELAHRGDPAEDLGWLCVNAWRFGQTRLPAGGFGTREALLGGFRHFALGHHMPVPGALSSARITVFAGAGRHWPSRFRGGNGFAHVAGTHTSHNKKHCSCLKEPAMSEAIPSAVLLLETMRTFLEKEITPQVNARSAYLLKVTNNLIDILIRETDAGSEVRAQECRGLIELLGAPQGTDKLADLNRRLCQRIADGSQSLDDEALWLHLLASTEARLAIDSPRYQYSAD
jgi:aminoglycoside phosphotransferase (APT) family kinase protein